MCGRFVASSPLELLAECFGLEESVSAPDRPGDLPVPGARYNVAPGSEVTAIVGGRRGRRLVMARWGLPIGGRPPSRLVANARAETLTSSPAFRSAVRRHRLLVPADGFYEWTGPRGRRQPILFRPGPGWIARVGSRVPLALAAIAGRSPSGREPEEEEEGGAGLAIVTVGAGPDVAPVHDRMPALLWPEDWDAWLDVEGVDAETAAACLAPAPASSLIGTPVSPAVNDARRDGPDLVTPLERPLTLFSAASSGTDTPPRDARTDAGRAPGEGGAA